MPRRRKSSIKREARSNVRALHDCAHRVAASNARKAGAEATDDFLLQQEDGIETPSHDEDAQSAPPSPAPATQTAPSGETMGDDSMGTGAHDYDAAMDEEACFTCPVSCVRAALRLGDRWIGTARVSELLHHCPLWIHQRPVDLVRVREISETVRPAIEGLASCAVDVQLPGSISVFHIPETSGPAPPQRQAVIDGQHRLLALHSLLEERKSEASASSIAPEGLDFVVVVDVYSVLSWDGAKELFLQLNLAESIPEIDLPDALAPEDRAVIDKAVSSLRSRFGSCFSSSWRCRPPNVHAPALREAIMKSGVVKRRGLTAQALLTRIEAINLTLSTKPIGELPLASRGRALRKAKRNGFFLGLTPSWLDSL